jgi:hypothetical protein
LKKLEFPLPKDKLYHVWLNLTQWFWKRWFLKIFSVFLLFCYYLPLEKSVFPLSFEQTWIPQKNKRPMGHIAHLTVTLAHLEFPFAPFDTRGPMTFINLLFFYVRKFSCKIQLFWLHSS